MLPDYLAPNLRVVFVGTAAATASAAAGHYYSGPGNKFWHLLWEAGLTGDRLLNPDQDGKVLTYGIGLTDLAKGVAASRDRDLKPGDYGVTEFISKMELFKPRVVAFNGKEAARKVACALECPEPNIGWAELRVAGSRAYVLPSSSGSNADRKRFAPKSSKAAWWIELGEAVGRV